MKVLLGVSVALFCNALANLPTENAIFTGSRPIVCEQGRKQIKLEDICDDKQDCSDNWDEALCDCTDTKLKCSSGTCEKNPQIGSSVCARCMAGYQYDGEQCRDINECDLMNNSSLCIGRASCLNFEGGFTCITCPKGFEAKMHNERYYKFVNQPRNYLLRSLFLCDDFNECAIDNPCAGLGHCVNQVGRFSCKCPPHHEPQGSVCRAVSSEEPLIVIAENTSLFVYDLHPRNLIETVKVKQLVVDVIAYKNSVFYAFATEVWEYNVDTRSHALIVEFEKDDQTLTSIKKLALDWELKRIYFLTGNSIHFVDFFGRGGPILSHKGAIKSIAVDAVARYLFFSEYNIVHRIHLDGSPASKKTIFAALAEVEHENTPTGQALVADPNIQVLYFINDRVLYSFDYDGQHARVMLTHAPYARIEPFEDRIYGVYRASAVHPVSLPRIGYSIGGEVRNATVLEFGSIKKPVALTVMSVVKFPESVGMSQPCTRKDVCTSDWCFHLPEPQSEGRRCVCAPGETEECTKIPIRSFRPINSVSAEINSARPLSAIMNLVVVHSLWIFGSKLHRII